MVASGRWLPLSSYSRSVCKMKFPRNRQSTWPSDRPSPDIQLHPPSDNLKGKQQLPIPVLPALAAAITPGSISA